MLIFITGGAFEGKKEYAAARFPEMRLVADYHETVRKELAAGGDPLSAAEALLADGKNLVITADELGCGIVPMDPFERKYREANGRVSCLIAAHADQVYLVAAGQALRIK